MSTRFRIAQQFGAGAPALYAAEPPYLRDDDAMPGAAPPRRPRAQAPALAEGAVYRAAEPTLSDASRQVLAQAGAGARARWNALWLASPEFMNQ
jgi:hypothetical protein